MRKVPAVALVIPALLLVLSASPSLASDGTCGAGLPSTSTTLYFAEGYTGGGFMSWLCVFNPHPEPQKMSVTVLYDGLPPASKRFRLEPNARATYFLNDIAGPEKEFALVLEATVGITAERAMYFNYRGIWKGCTVGEGTERLSNEWYFAEGCTRRGFEEWLLLANPGSEPARAWVSFYLEDGRVLEREVRIDPGARKTVFVNEVVGTGHDVSAAVRSDRPLVAERAVYFSYGPGWSGGHVACGKPEPRRKALFPEGYTGPGFDEWLCLFIPPAISEKAEKIPVKVTFLLEEGMKRERLLEVEPGKRTTYKVNDLLGIMTGVSMALESETPLLAERPMYFNYRGCCSGGHVSWGVEEFSREWYLAEGTTRPGFHPYLCLLNPHRESTCARIFFHLPSGEVVHKDVVLPAESRHTLFVPAVLPRGLDFSVYIRSVLPVAVERPQYFTEPGFLASNAVSHIHALSVGIGERVVGTRGEESAARYISDFLSGLGYRVETQTVPLPDGRRTLNVVASTGAAERLGEETRRTLVLGAHYDTKGGTGSPGANDNASGTAVVLELARCLAERGELPGLEVVLVLFGGEEELVSGTELHHFGSRYFVAHMPSRVRERMVGALILDMVGVGQRLYARTMGIGPMDLCSSLMGFASSRGMALPYLKSGSLSDHEPFERAGIPAVWLQVRVDPYLHTPRDTLDKIDPRHLETVGRLVLDFVSYVARQG